MPRYKMLIALLVLVPLKGLTAEEKPQGWLWYKDPVSDVKVEEKKEAPQPSSQESKPMTAVEEMASNRQKYDEAMAKAILYPTLENVTHARHIHDAIIAQTSEFQKSWSLSELLDPQAPAAMTSPGALKIARQEEDESLKEEIQELSKTYGLIFVFKKDCPYCHQFAPVVKQFSKDYGFDIEGLSSQEECFEGMVCSTNARAVQNINPDGAYPKLFLANPKTNQVISVANGFVTQTVLLQNMKIAIEFLKTQGEQ
ncbi:MAG: conjugal transfer protein TraF [Simkaniaceae bacterium]|nr:conjugal transfer protein TraF [Simkaniaceae bacterium]